MESQKFLVAENAVLRSEMERSRAKAEAAADECHILQRKLLEEKKRRQESYNCTIFTHFIGVKY